MQGNGGVCGYGGVGGYGRVGSYGGDYVGVGGTCSGMRDSPVRFPGGYKIVFLYHPIYPQFELCLNQQLYF
jgi:hypothetical protein